MLPSGFFRLFFFPAMCYTGEQYHPKARRHHEHQYASMWIPGWSWPLWPGSPIWPSARSAGSWGAGLTVTEMVSAKALCYQDRKTRSLLRLGPGEHPAGVQIFGSDAACMAEAACMAAELSGADFIDINMGCPVGKVVSNGDGSALMKDPEKATRIAEAVVKACPVPVTVKMRRGWDKGSINAVELARMLEQAGVSAVAVHAAPAPKCTPDRRTGSPSVK